MRSKELFKILFDIYMRNRNGNECGVSNFNESDSRVSREVNSEYVPFEVRFKNKHKRQKKRDFLMDFIKKHQKEWEDMDPNTGE